MLMQWLAVDKKRKRERRRFDDNNKSDGEAESFLRGKLRDGA